LIGSFELKGGRINLQEKLSISCYHHNTIVRGADHPPRHPYRTSEHIAFSNLLTALTSQVLVGFFGRYTQTAGNVQQDMLRLSDRLSNYI
jgi:hypothetical protein